MQRGNTPSRAEKIGGDAMVEVVVEDLLLVEAVDLPFPASTLEPLGPLAFFAARWFVSVTDTLVMSLSTLEGMSDILQKYLYLMQKIGTPVLLLLALGPTRKTALGFNYNLKWNCNLFSLCVTSKSKRWKFACKIDENRCELTFVF